MIFYGRPVTPGISMKGYYLIICTIANHQSFRNHLNPDGFPPYTHTRTHMIAIAYHGTASSGSISRLERFPEMGIVLLRSRMATTIATSIKQNCTAQAGIDLLWASMMPMNEWFSLQNNTVHSWSKQRHIIFVQGTVAVLSKRMNKTNTTVWEEHMMCFCFKGIAHVFVQCKTARAKSVLITDFVEVWSKIRALC